MGLLYGSVGRNKGTGRMCYLGRGQWGRGQGGKGPGDMRLSGMGQVVWTWSRGKNGGLKAGDKDLEPEDKGPGGSGQGLEGQGQGLDPPKLPLKPNLQTTTRPTTTKTAHLDTVNS